MEMNRRQFLEGLVQAAGVITVACLVPKCLPTPPDVDEPQPIKYAIRGWEGKLPTDWLNDELVAVGYMGPIAEFRNWLDKVDPRHFVVITDRGNGVVEAQVILA